MRPSKKTNPQEHDKKIPNPPADGISSIAVNGSLTVQTNMLISTSWDNCVNCYELKSDNNGELVDVVPRSQIKLDGPVLCSDISTQDHTTVFTGGCDNTVRMWNATQGANAVQTIGRHNAAVKSLKFVPENNMLISGSWDKTLMGWDMRQPNPVAKIDLSDRVYCMDAKGQAVVAVTADRMVHVFDMSKGSKLMEYKSPLTYQTRCISIFHDNQGYAMGCIEGRVALDYFNELQYKSNPVQKPDLRSFVFKCHRDGDDIYSVNAIAFHNKNTFASAGSDGVISCWDKDVKHRLGHLEQFKKVNSITDIKFSPMGTMMFYALSYDWSKGAAYNDPKLGNEIMYHSVAASEVTPKDPGLKK